MTNAMTTDTKIVKALAKVAYPDYRGRKFSVCQARTYTMEDYWDGGSRCYAVAVDLATGKMVATQPVARNPFNAAAHATFEIPAGIGILERQIFCGKDCGITLHVAPPPAALTSAAPALEVR
jgi:hypothetical protein